MNETRLRAYAMATGVTEENSGHPALYGCLDAACRMVKPRSYLEIGVRDGDSMIYLLGRADLILLAVGVDNWGYRHGGTGQRNDRYAKLRIEGFLLATNHQAKVHLETMDSNDFWLRAGRGTKFDLLLIDGNHDPEIAAEDIRQGWELVNVGGGMVVDEFGRLYDGDPFLARLSMEIFAERGLHPTCAFWDEHNGAALFIKESV